MTGTNLKIDGDTATAASAVSDDRANAISARQMKRNESRIRRLVNSHGYRLHKSRAWKNVPHPDNHGEYMVIDNATNISLLGHRYDATLEEIEEAFND